MSKQPHLFVPDTDIPAFDPHPFQTGAPQADRPRLHGQCAAIVARLRQGPATNQELAAIALKYTSRLSDIRAAGYQVDCIQRDHATGLSVYALRDNSGEAA